MKRNQGDGVVFASRTVYGNLAKVGNLLSTKKFRNTLENSWVKKLRWTIRLTMSGNSRKPMAIQILRIILSRFNIQLNRFYLAKWYRMFQ